MRVKLSDVTKYAKGTQINRDDLIENGQYIYLNGGINPSGRWNDANVKGNTVTISEGGNSSGYVNYMTEPFWCGAHCYYLFDGPKNTRYLYYALKSQQERLFNIRSGACMPNIKKTDLGKFEFEFDTDERKQNKIVSVLSKIDAVIGERKRELELLDELVKSRFVVMFGDVIRNSKAWQMRVFEDVAASRLGKMLDSKHQTGKYSYPYLANFNVQWFRFNIENLNQMDFDEDDRAEFELKDGDLLVCEGGEIGRCAVWHNEIQPCFFQKALHRVRCNRQIIHPDYLAWWFKYNCDHDGFTAIAGSKATIAHLPGIKLKQLQVAVPPIELQEQFATFVAQTDKSKLIIQKSLDELETLNKALMQKYFGGN